VRETGPAHQDRGPRTPRPVYRAEQQKRKLSIELPVLTGHGIMNIPLPDFLQLVPHTEARLDFAFTAVKWGLGNGIHHAQNITLLQRELVFWVNYSGSSSLSETLWQEY
jgi:hypothetical protein